MTGARVLRANAKVNLWLRVVGKREDGFHEIESVFQSVGLSDDLRFEPATDLEVEMNGSAGNDIALPAPRDNLVLRAAESLRDRAGVSAGARIKVTKRIPIGGGLGGGSADAAATLVALNGMWDTGLSIPQLTEVAAENGSDTPFCVRGGTAVGRGRGERLSFEEPGPEMFLVLGTSREPLLTRDVYAACTTAPPGAPAALLRALRTGDPVEVARHLRNDLEAAAMSLRPELEGKKEAVLAAGALGALVSGSGPTVFGICSDESQAAEVGQRLREASVFDGVEIVRTRTSGVEPPG